MQVSQNDVLKMFLSTDCPFFCYFLRFIRYSSQRRYYAVLSKFYCCLIPNHPHRPHSLETRIWKLIVHESALITCASPFSIIVWYARAKFVVTKLFITGEASTISGLKIINDGLNLVHYFMHGNKGCARLSKFNYCMKRWFPNSECLWV